MSLATLKKKTKAIFNNPYIGDKYGKYSTFSAIRMNSYNNKNGNVGVGFSLNGTHRSQGYVGQTMHSRHFPQTPMRGNVARGHGGCCGKYPTNNGHIIQSGVTDTNDPSVVKKSVINTSGFFHTHYRWIWRPQPFIGLKPDATNHINTHEYYTKNLASKVKYAADSKNHLTQQKPCCTNNIDTTTNLMEYNIHTKPHTTTITKPPIININGKKAYKASLDAGEYTNYLTNNCQIFDEFKFTSNKQNMVFGCSNPK